MIQGSQLHSFFEAITLQETTTRTINPKKIEPVNY